MDPEAVDKAEEKDLPEGGNDENILYFLKDPFIFTLFITKVVNLWFLLDIGMYLVIFN